MREPTVRVRYVSGEEFVVPASEWPSLPGEGVDAVAIGHTLFTWTSGQSIYWVYQEDNKWIMGSGPVGYGVLSPEVLVGDTDRHETRTIEYMPDLPHGAVKLGWWWPDEPRRPVY